MYGKILPHPWEFDHNILPRGRELAKKIAQMARICLLKKLFLGQGGLVPSWN